MTPFEFIPQQQQQLQQQQQQQQLQQLQQHHRRLIQLQYPVKLAIRITGGQSKHVETVERTGKVVMENVHALVV